SVAASPLASCAWAAMRATALYAGALLPVAGMAQDFPSKPIRFIVPYAPGGGPDVLARKTAEELGKVLGGTVVVENKVGAGGILAGEHVVRAPADGYTLMLGSSTHVTQKIIQPTVSFDPASDFTHIVRGGFSPQVLVVSADSPYRTVQDLIEAARRSNDPFNYASGGIGSAAHLAGAAFSSAAKANTMHIPYRGSVASVPSFMRGDVQFAFPVTSTVLPQITDGKVRAMAVTSAQRLPQLPEVPTLNEVFGSKELALDAWSGIWAPKGLPEPITEKLEQAFRSVYAQPEIQEFYERAGSMLAPTDSPAAFTAFVEAETAKYTKIVADNHIKVDQ